MNDDVYGYPNDAKIPIFCATLLDGNIVDPISFSTGIFFEEFRREVYQFGKYAVCLSVQEFADKACEYICGKKYYYQFGKVAYLNYEDVFDPLLSEDNISMSLQLFYGMLYKHSGMIDTCFFSNRQMISFQKNTSYRWQNEWRFIIKNNEDNIISQTQDHYIMSIGKIGSAKIYDIDEVVNAKILLDPICKHE